MERVGLEAALPPKKRHARASRRKRLRLKKCASLEPTAEKAPTKKKAPAEEKVDVQQHEMDNVLLCHLQTQEIPVSVLVVHEDEDQSQKKHRQQDEALGHPQPPKQEQVKQEEQDRSADGAATEVDNQDELAEYERKRMATVLRNQAFMQTIGISTAKMAARTTIGDEAAKEARRHELTAKRADNAVRKAELLNQPLRKSRRLAGEILPSLMFMSDDEDDAIENVRRMREMVVPSWKRMRQPYKHQLHMLDATDDDGEAFCKEIAVGRGSLEKVMRFDEDIDYSLADNDVVKVVPNRVTALSFVPRADRVVLACGDHSGHITLWSPGNGSTNSSAALLQPHDDSVSQIIFAGTSTLISSSTDGTVHEFDLSAAESSVLLDVSEETKIASLAQSGHPEVYYAGCYDGTVRMFDRRARSTFGWSYALHHKRINSVDQHPSLDQFFATASQDKEICLWDKRKMSDEKRLPLARLPHRNFVQCAHFSPRNGVWLVAVGQDSYIDMYDTSKLVNTTASDTVVRLPGSIRVPHKSETGTPTKLRPAWDSKRSDQFVIGCLDGSARLKIFRAGDRRPIRELRDAKRTSTTDVVAVYHPQLDLIASGYLSGQVSLWRGKPKA